MPEDWSSILEKDLQKLSEVAGVQPVKTEKLIPGERRDAAILFLDLKGFTAMSETMDHEMVIRSLVVLCKRCQVWSKVMVDTLS